MPAESGHHTVVKTHSDEPLPHTRQLFGTWQLVSVEDIITGRAEPLLPYGGHPTGFLMYQPDGHMCATLTDGERPRWRDADHPTDAEKVAYYDSFVAYCGTFEVDPEKSIVIHYPTVAWWPGFVGTTQARPFRLEGDKLIITVTESLGDPRVEKRVLVWQRAKGLL
jgi:hypothetical protein